MPFFEQSDTYQIIVESEERSSMQSGSRGWMDPCGWMWVGVMCLGWVPCGFLPPTELVQLAEEHCADSVSRELLCHFSKAFVPTALGLGDKRSTYHSLSYLSWPFLNVTSTMIQALSALLYQRILLPPPDF